jgi:RNA polymerase sigma factor (sigma-70 family)
MDNPPHTCVSAAVSGEDADAAFRCLYAEHGPALLRLATTLTGGDHGRAEDLVQETMLRAWTHRNNLDMQHRPPRAWLITVARRLAVDAHRARRARPPRSCWKSALPEPVASGPTAASTNLASVPRSLPCPVPSARCSPRSITATGRWPTPHASCRSRPARSDHAPSMGCAQSAESWRLAMRSPSPVRSLPLGLTMAISVPAVPGPVQSYPGSPGRCEHQGIGSTRRRAAVTMAPRHGMVLK